MFDFGPTFLWTIVNLLLLYIVLRKLLFKRVTALMEKRTWSVSESLAQAEKKQAEAEVMTQETREKLEAARQESSRIVEEGVAHGKAEYDEILREARKEAADMIRKTTEAMENDRLRLMRDIYDQIVRLSLEAASRVVEDNMDTDRNRKIVERILEEEGLGR